MTYASASLPKTDWLNGPLNYLTCNQIKALWGYAFLWILDEEEMEVTESQNCQLETPKGHVTLNMCGLAIQRSQMHHYSWLTAEAKPGQKWLLLVRQVLVRRSRGQSLMRFYDIQAGKIIDGVDTKVIFLKKFTWCLSMVLQDTRFFEGTIRKTWSSIKTDIFWWSGRRQLERLTITLSDLCRNLGYDTALDDSVTLFVIKRSWPHRRAPLEGRLKPSSWWSKFHLSIPVQKSWFKSHGQTHGRLRTSFGYCPSLVHYPYVTWKKYYRARQPPRTHDKWLLCWSYNNSL